MLPSAGNSLGYPFSCMGPSVVLTLRYKELMEKELQSGGTLKTREQRERE